MKKMASSVWVRRKAHICELCGRVMDMGEEYALRMITGEDACKNCKVRIEEQSDRLTRAQQREIDELCDADEEIAWKEHIWHQYMASRRQAVKDMESAR